MWITKVELHQIKSYSKRTTIDLVQGVNAICGKNGAGKSTILEAIGLALFGKSAYKNQEQFVHERAKRGEITITLFDSRDERLYQVVRPIKGGPPYVYDPETHRELAVGVEDVQQWLRDCMRVEPTTDLKALFENAIGVAQGLLTVSFLETEANRRKVFDPLLNVEDYKQAYDKLRAVNTQVKEWQAENIAQQARLEGQLEALPGHQAEVQELTEKIQTAEGQLNEVSLKLNDLAERLAALEKQKVEVDGLTRQFESLSGQVAAGRAQLQAAQAELEGAMQAKAAVERSEADYRTYEEAQKERDELEKKRQTRDKLYQRLVDSKQQVSKLEQNAHHLQQQLQDVARAEARLVKLKPQVEKQQSLEGELQQAKTAVEALKTAKKRLAGEEQRQEKLEQGLAQVRVEVQKRQALAQEIDGLEQQRRQQLEELDRLNLELAALEQQRSDLHEALQEAQDGANSYKNLQDRIREANETLSRRQERLRQMQAEITQRQDLEAQREALSAQRQGRQAELVSLETQLGTQEGLERQARQALNEWQTKAGTLQNRQTNLTDVETRLAKAHAELARLEAGVTQRQQHLAEIKGLEVEGLEAGQQRDLLKDDVSRYKAKLAEIEEALAALAVEADSPCPVCRKPLSEHDIGSLKEHYQVEIKALTIRLAEAETSLQELESTLKRGQRQIKKLQGELETLPNQLQLEKQQELVVSDQADAAALQVEIISLAEAPTQVNRLQEEIGRIETALSQLKETGAKLRRADQADEQKQQQLQSQISQLARLAEVEQLEGELKALQVSLEHWIAKAEPLADAPQRLVELQAEDSLLSAQRAAHLQRTQAISQEREGLAQQINQCQSQINNLAAPTRIDALQLELEAQKGIVTECLNQVAGLTTAPETLKALEAALEELGDPRRAYGVAEAEAVKRPALEADLAQLQSQLQEAQQTKLGIEQELLPFAKLDEDLEQLNATLSRTRNGHETYLEHRAVAESLPQREARAAEIRQSVAGLEQQKEEATQDLASASTGYDPADHEARTAEREENRIKYTQLETQLREYHPQLTRAQAKVEALAVIAAELDEQKREGHRLEHLQDVVDFIRRTIRDAGPEITRRLVRAVSLRADQIFADIINDYQQELIWDENYGITLRRDGYERDFQQLSGGEAMAAALAVRLALLQSMSAVDVAFFDEPTANLDPERRANLAEQIARIKGFSQLVVISHDDTFEQDTGHVIHITKDEQGYSQVV